MKKGTTNQFDYPNSQVQGFKKYQPEKTTSLSQAQYQKQRYKFYLKEQQDIQRRRVKEQKSRKKQQERLHNKQKIKNQLQIKKKELQQLERVKKQALEIEKRSFQLAVIKEEQDNIKRIEQQQRMKQFADNANARFMEALRRMEDEKQQRQLKKTQAQYRRKVVQETEKIQRGKAIQYKNYVQERQKNIEPEIKRGFEQFKQSLGRVAYNKNVDYTKTRIHNPAIIVQNQNQSPNAIEQAQVAQQVRRQSLLKKTREVQDMRRKSEERGKKALLQLQRQREYQEYCREAEEKSKLYNMDRIQAGKANQYVGIKPSTLQQMEINKKIRSEQQFQRLFLGGSNPQWIGRKATKHDIIQARIPTYLPPQSLLNNYVKNSKDESQIPNVSAGKYSFESSGIQDLTSVKKIKINENNQISSRNNIPEGNSQQEGEEEPRNLQREPQEVTKKLVKQNRKIEPSKYYPQDQQLGDSLDVGRSNKRQVVYNNQFNSLPQKQKLKEQQGLIPKSKKKGEEDLNYSQSQESFV